MLSMCDGSNEAAILWLDLPKCQKVSPILCRVYTVMLKEKGGSTAVWVKISWFQTFCTDWILLERIGFWTYCHFRARRWPPLLEGDSFCDFFPPCIAEGGEDPHGLPWSWMLDLERTCALLIGLCIGSMLHGPPIMPCETQSSAWLSSVLFSNGLHLSVKQLGKWSGLWTVWEHGLF